MILAGRLAGAGGGTGGVGVGFDEFSGGVFLMSPLEVVGHGYVGDTEVDAHVLHVGVVLIQLSGALVVFAEWHQHACAELPSFPIIRQLDD